MATLCEWHDAVVTGVMSDVTTEDAEQVRTDLRASLARSCADCDDTDHFVWRDGHGWVERADVA